MAAEAFDATCASLTTGVVAPGRKSLPPVRLRQPIAAAVSPARPLCARRRRRLRPADVLPDPKSRRRGVPKTCRRRAASPFSANALQARLVQHEE
eukprot:5556983-Ditylum_brightwellii.AAC.1